MLSARALIMRVPIAGSVAQYGTSPQPNGTRAGGAGAAGGGGAQQVGGHRAAAVAQDAAALAAQPLAVLEPAHLFEQRDAGVGVGANAEPVEAVPPPVREGEVGQAVAQVRLG